MLGLSHKKLIAWQKAILLLPLVYDCCKKLSPEEKYNLIAQMKSAALSISNNISEGAARKTKKDKNHFFTTARSSTVEVDNCLTAPLILNSLKRTKLLPWSPPLTEVFKLISGLIDSNERQEKTVAKGYLLLATCYSPLADS